MQQRPKIYYVYIYLDPRKPGKFQYGKLSFDYEPFYVGKGKETRKNEHINEAIKVIEHRNINKPSYKTNKIIKILNIGLRPVVLTLHDNISDKLAQKLEIKYINEIGRICDKTGPLLNFTKGGDGSSGRIQSNEEKEKRVKSLMKSTLLNTVRSERHRRKMSRIAKKRMKNPEVIKKLSQEKIGSKNPMFGKTTSQKQKDAVKQAHREGRVKLTASGRDRIIKKNRLRKGKKNINTRIDCNKYVVSNNKSKHTIDGAVKFQKFCKDNKLQVLTLKNNIDKTISEKDIKRNNKLGKNTIGWKLEIIYV